MQTTFVCPQTSTALRFDLPTDETTLHALWSLPLNINCPFCGAVHVTDYKDAYMAGALSEFECIPADMKEARLH